VPRELKEHRQYLQDASRVGAFERGIAAAVRPGDVVVDLGCGTGILGFLACRAGASRVYAIDEGGMAEVARSLAAANGFADRITIIRGHSGAVSLPERADVVVSDQIGYFGFEAGVLDYFEDARRRFLKPGGRFVPRQVSLWVAPIACAELWDDTAFWSTRPYGFEMSPAQDIAWNSGHALRVETDDLLAAGRCAASLTLGEPHRCISFTVDLPIERAATMHGVAGWFVAGMDGDTTMSNAPGDPRRINRRNLVFLLDRPLAVTPGEVVRVHMLIRPHESLVRWVIERWPDAEALQSGDESRRLDRFDQSTFRGMLISADEVRRTRPSSVPRLSERGLARKLVLDLTDGRSTVADIEQALFARYPGLFADASDAGRFVAEVVTRYAE
jgi:protein arginine N-methyltransferase 1